MADNVSPSERSRIMAAVGARDTGCELVVQRLAKKTGRRFRLGGDQLPGSPDLVFRGQRAVVFVHGCFWHAHDCGRCRIPQTRREYWKNKIERNRRRDRRAVDALRREGWRVMVVWECQTTRAGEARLLGRLRRFLGVGPGADSSAAEKVRLIRRG